MVNKSKKIENINVENMLRYYLDADYMNERGKRRKKQCEAIKKKYKKPKKLKNK